MLHRIIKHSEVEEQYDLIKEIFSYIRVLDYSVIEDLV